jgi:non-specific protein-tyrosine kinase
MEFLAYWQIIRKRLWLLLLLALLGTGAAVGYSVRQVPQYRTTTTLFLNPAASSPLLPYQSTKTVQSVANTYIEFMRTRSFAGLVAQNSGPDITPEQVLAALTTQYVPDTQFFRINATATDPQRAQIIANTAAQVLIAENSARQQAEQEQIQLQRSQDPEIKRLTDLRDTLRDQLATQNQAIGALQNEIGSLQLRQPSERNDQRLQALRQQVVDMQSARAQAITSLAQVQSALVSNGAAGATPDTAVVVDEAPLPAAPLSRQIPERGLLALLFSLGVGAGIAFLLEYLDYTVKSADALELAYGLPVQGVLGVAAGKAAYQLTASRSYSPVAEAVRALRTSIQLAGMAGPLRSLLITSAIPGEGKTFVAANLAVSLAMSGKRVVLVDADLRKPNLHTVFGLPREPGLTNLVVAEQPGIDAALKSRLRTILKRARRPEALAGQATTLTVARAQDLLRDIEADDPETRRLIGEARDLLRPDVAIEQYLQPTAVENLWVLTCGIVPPNPAELLGSPHMRQVAEQLAQFADMVVYDSPPAATVTDAVVLAPQVDAVLQVVKAGSTRIDVLRRCKAAIQQHSGTRLLGPVLNHVRQADLGAYSYYYTYEYVPKIERNGKNGNGRHG